MIARPAPIFAMTGFKGPILNSLGRHEEALDASECALRVDPELSDGHAQKSAALFGLARYEEALQAADAGLATGADCAELHEKRAAALLALERFEEALEAMEKALALEPCLGLAQYVRACVLHKNGKIEAVHVALEEGLKNGVKKARPLEPLEVWQNLRSDPRLRSIFEKYRVFL